jgi:uncharacterized membrane protein
MKSLTNILMKGLAAVLPIALTLYVIWWLVRTVESLMRGLITIVVPPEHYRPGMGILVGLLVLFAVGTLVNAYIVRQALSVWDEFLERIPLVKTVYSAFRDIARLLPSGQGKRDLQSVVIWRVGEARLLGFVTRDGLPELEKPAGGVHLVAVYFPLSYMLGGVTLYLPRHAVEHVDMPVEAAMRLAITGGMATTHGHGVADAGASAKPLAGG